MKPNQNGTTPCKFGTMAQGHYVQTLLKVKIHSNGQTFFREINMIRQTLNQTQLDGKIVKSILEFDPDGEHELFVLFSPGTTNGPSISRTGKGSPTMTNLIAVFADPTPDPDLQRFGNLVVDDEVRKSDIERLNKKLIEETNESEKDYIQTHLNDLEKQKTYYEIFNDVYNSEYSILAMQGFGDLTMNLWNVGYVNDRITKKPEILHLFDEPLDRRTYSCLVKWKDPVRYTIENLRFDIFEFNRNKTSNNVVVNVKADGIANKIEFAIFGQQLVKNNIAIPDLEEQIHQFADIRHVFQLPNINPTENLHDNDTGYPRTYFGRKQNADVWFGEEQLLASRNLRKAALRGSIELELDRPGVSSEILRAALCKSGYEEVLEDKRLLTRQDLNVSTKHISQWKVVEDIPNRIEILLKENIYPCTMVGIRKGGGLSFLAWKGTYSEKPGWTVREAAEHIKEQGTIDAILCDEGADVFQYFDRDGELRCIIPPGRSQHRAVLVVAKKHSKPNV